MSVKIYINTPKVINKVTNKQFGLFVANEWKRLINPYTPYRNGVMQNTAVIRPFEIEYIQPYSQYVYYGEKYIDPIYEVGGFTNDGGASFFSRPGVAKIPSGEDLNYRKDSNPFASKQWDLEAEKNGQKDKLYRSINRYLEKL